MINVVSHFPYARMHRLRPIPESPSLADHQYLCTLFKSLASLILESKIHSVQSTHKDVNDGTITDRLNR